MTLMKTAKLITATNKAWVKKKDAALTAEMVMIEAIIRLNEKMTNRLNNCSSLQKFPKTAVSESQLVNKGIRLDVQPGLTLSMFGQQYQAIQGKDQEALNYDERQYLLDGLASVLDYSQAAIPKKKHATYPAWLRCTSLSSRGFEHYLSRDTDTAGRRVTLSEGRGWPTPGDFDPAQADMTWPS